jgi:ribosome-associated protein
METISKSERKRRCQWQEELALTLAALTGSDLRNLPVDAETLQAIRDSHPLRGGARKRQIKYLAKLLRERDVTAVHAFLEQRKGLRLRVNQRQHQAEYLRDAFINAAIAALEESRYQQIPWDGQWQSEALTEFLAAHPHIDERDIRQMAASYAQSRNRLYYRELFRVIKAAIDLANHV